MDEAVVPVQVFHMVAAHFRLFCKEAKLCRTNFSGINFPATVQNETSLRDDEDMVRPQKIAITVMSQENYKENKTSLSL